MNQGHISSLESRHAELDAQLELENNRPHPNEDAIHRIKKKKLHIKDMLTQELATT